MSERVYGIKGVLRETVALVAVAGMTEESRAVLEAKIKMIQEEAAAQIDRLLWAEAEALAWRTVRRGDCEAATKDIWTALREAVSRP